MSVHLPKGTRDFLPNQMRNRNRVIAILRSVFERFGFEPLETPAFERIETLTGKYGDEGEKLMYRILARGEAGKRGEVDSALRYDLTVPLARVVAMNRDLRMPFKRYQIQPVWRADRPQKGRFREFYQCDVDIIGTQSPSADAECLAVVATALGELGFREYTIRLNDRRILSDLAASAGASGPREEMSVLIALDKLDKIGKDGVDRELAERGFTGDTVATMWAALERQPSNEATLAHLDTQLTERGQEGVAVLRQLLEATAAMGVPEGAILVDPTLARGLDYYTGPVFETAVTEPKVGSISGGGRYDGLIGMFSGQDVPAVGVSLGMERIIAVMEELGMLPDSAAGADVLVTVFGDDTRPASIAMATRLREAGIATELYLGETSSRKAFKKQMKYANAGGYPWVIVIGPDEAREGRVTLKNMRSGEQESVDASAVAGRLG